MKIPRLFGLHAKPSPRLKRFLSILPFILLLGVYLIASHARLKENPSDKLLPSPLKMVKAVKRMAFTEDKRSGDYLMLKDTTSSLRRIGIGVSLAAVLGLLVGLHLGLLPGLRSTFLTFITFLSIIPPLSILPIIFITFGVGELAKVMLIFLGTVFLISRDLTIAVRAIPKEQITKALTLGASEFQVIYRIIMPQIIPRLIDTTRLSLGAAWLFLIASEAVASTDGLGYRIFLVRRYLAMDVIIPYVIWITFIGYTLDWILRKTISLKYSWYLESKE
ncbi:ABC transporter permease [Thermodesulfobacteriota bacterium]